MMTNQELSKYWQWLQEGKSPEDIKKDLLIRGVSEQEATEVILVLDNSNLRNRIDKEVSFHAKSYRLVGLILIIVSLSFAVYSIVFSIFSTNTILFLVGGSGAGFAALSYSNKLKSKG